MQIHYIYFVYLCQALFLNKCIKIMNYETEKLIGANLKKLREIAGFTQDMLATKMQVCGCDITRSAIAKIEVGQRHLYPDEIILIKQILNIDYDKIFEI